MTSLSTRSTPLGNSQCGGSLFTFPRELRDKIYRLLVKKHYIIYITQSKNSIVTPTKDEHDFAILQVSKAVSHEASDTLYSEGVFRFSIDFSMLGILVLPSQLTDRMKNVEFDFSGLSIWHSQLFPPYSFPKYQDHINTICHSTIADFTGTEIMRNRLHVRFLAGGPAIIDTLSVHIIERLKALVGFRTVILEIVPVRVSLGEMGWPIGYQEEFWRMRKTTATRIMREMRHTLEPTWGPATEGYHEEVQLLTFHPGKHAVNSNEKEGPQVTY